MKVCAVLGKRKQGQTTGEKIKEKAVTQISDRGTKADSRSSMTRDG